MPASKFRFSSFVFCAAVFSASISFAQSQQGPYYPFTVTEQAFGCLACPGSTWIDHSNAELADNQFASTQMASWPSCFQTSCYFARALEPENFIFNIPSNAVITGVVAEVVKMASAMNSIQDSLVQLLVYGLPAGDSRADTAWWSLSPGYKMYGDSMDLWGIALTPLQVNSPTFGLFFKPQNKSMVSSFTTAFVDYVRITIYYQTSTGILEHQVSSEAPSVYLNVAEQELIIKKNTGGDIDKVRVFNSLGMQVFEQDAGALFVAVSTRNFSNGVYLVTIQSGQTIFKRKIVVTKS